MLNDSQRREKELAVYDAVLRLIARGEDPAALTVHKIAAEADIGKGTVYEYFPSKEAILRGLTAYCMDTELRQLERAAAPCQTLEALLDALLAYFAELARQRAGIYRVIAGALARQTGSDACQPDAAVLARLRGLLHATITRLRAAGEIDPDLDEEYCLYALAAAGVSCTVLLSAAGDGAPGGTVLRFTRRLLQRALCAPEQ